MPWALQANKMAERRRHRDPAGLGVFLVILLGLAVRVSWAEPLVPAYERFAEAFSMEESGLLLATELNCTRCHAHARWKGKGAPVLDGVGARLQEDWLRAFLTDPQGTKPGTTMPDVLSGEKDAASRAETVDVLVHFLVSRKSGWKAPRLAKYSDPHHGGRQFGRLGCAACHADPVATNWGAVHRAAGLVSLEHLEAKYSHAALTDFLQRPLDHRPGGRMPDFELNLQEATDMAAYLLGTSNQTANAGRAPLRAFSVDETKAERGRTFFARLGCANCHSLDEITSSLVAPDYAALERRGDRGRCARVHYGLRPSQREALAAPLPPADTPVRLRHRLAALHCYACHERGDIGGPAEIQLGHFTGDVTLGNEGLLPPPLTGVGRKFQAAWLEKVLHGKGRLRPYMHTRMPLFGKGNLVDLVEDLRTEDREGGGAGEREKLALDGGEVEAGRQLLGTKGGVGCITCHALQERQGLAMRGLTLSSAVERYEPEWFRENLIHPMKTRPGTLMPSFWPGGVAGNQAILAGDTERQIASIWRYLAALEESSGSLPLPPGYPDFDPGAFEIVPQDRPVIQRTFMEGAGTHAIAVGFPDGVHFAFDAERCRVALAWRGRFLDAYKAWFSRMDPSAEPLGQDLKRFPPEAEDELETRQFGGYILDRQGVPTFLYREGDRTIRCRIQPNKKKGLTRKRSVQLPDGEVIEELEEEIVW